jgi:hypothetical protein
MMMYRLLLLTKLNQNKLKLQSLKIRVITKLPNSEQSYRGKVKTHKCINRQNQSTTGKMIAILTYFDLILLGEVSGTSS